MRSLLLATFGLVALLTQQAQAAVIIDNFDDPFATKSSTAGNPVTVTTFSTDDTPEILGKYRDVTWAFTPASTQGIGTIGYDDERATTSFTVKEGTSADVTIAYDGAGVNGPGFASQNLSGDLGFLLTADWNPNASPPGTPLLLGFSVNGVTKSVLIADTSDVAQYFIPFTYWGLSVDFSDVTEIAMNFDLGKTDNATFADLRTGVQGNAELAPLVPEPSSLALACMGLIGFGGYARRKIKARA